MEVIGITEDQKFEIERTIAENEMALSDAVADNEQKNLEAYKRVQEAKQQALTATLDVASSVFGSMATLAQMAMQAQIETEGKTADEIKEAQKKKEEAANWYARIATAQAVMDTYKSANEAYASMASIPYVGPVLGAAAAGAAIASGIVNVKQILKAAADAKLQASASISQGSQTQAPSALNTNPITYTRNLLGDKETDELNKPIKCYVLQSEIDAVNTRVKVTEQNASF